ncbi:SEC-C metal-binding domain-containing protein [Acinetobacter baumannii]|nr:SEC-C metal-binding domain-containing protein [Acinetobacter baumannii]MDC5439417.1 SEC-C metal-binding domain-containing protein [Acinetobacter baumannii]
MRTEQEIFKILEEICSQPGFIEVISFLSWRDTFIHQQGENTDIEDLLKCFDLSRLSRTELSTLVGLLCKNGITEKKLSHLELQDYVEKIDSLMKELHGALSFGNFDFEAIMNDPNLLKSGSVLREAIFYAGDGAYKHQYRDLARIRYAKDDLWIKENKGFTIDEAIGVFTSIDQLHINKANSSNIRKQGFSYIFQFTLEELENKSGININIVKNVITAFSSLPQTGMECFNNIDDFNHRNAYPIIQLGNEKFISFQSYSIWESLYESPFFWFDADDVYKKIASDNRGAFTEDFSADKLISVFGKENVYKNINIHKGKKIVGEIDVLVIFGKYALVFQAKSKKLTIEARKGNSQKLEDDFKRAVHKAYDQALECCDFLQDSSVVFKQEDRVLNLDNTNLKSIFPICIISDYYPALAAQTREFLNIRTSQTIKHPYVMDVFLLDLITEMLDSPLFFLDYLEKRCDFGLALLANHELTILSTYIKQNLYFQDNPDMIMLEDSLSGELELSMLARREGMNVLRTPDGLLTLEHEYKLIGSLLKELKYSASPKAQKLGFLLLSLSRMTLKQLDDAIKKMVDAFSYGKEHSDITIGISEGNTGLTIHCNDIEIIESSIQLKDYCKFRKYSTKADSWIGLIYSPSELKIRLIDYDDRPWKKDAQMDQVVEVREAQLAKRPTINKGKNPFGLSTMIREMSKIGRNEQCPCGSGKKYKKCCLNS